MKAEGIRESAILKAQGARSDEMTRAQGAAESLKKAEAEAQALKMIYAVMPNADPAAYLIAMQYIKALPEMTAGKDDKLVLIPYEVSSLVGLTCFYKEVI